MKTLSEKDTDLFMNLYPLQPVILDHGKGCEVYDTAGKRYLDFAAGIAVVSLGHAHPAIVAAIREQTEKLMMCPSSYLTEPRIEAASLLVTHSCFDQVFFCNSGTESVEAALRLARVRAHAVKGPDSKDTIAFDGSFHGRTFASASVTAKAKSDSTASPYMQGVHFAKFGDLESVKALMTEKVCAIIVEPVQGEGGLIPATPEFLKGLRTLADQYDAALIFDEVQVGMGRIGTLFAYEDFDVEPDIIALAKGMGGGFPVGAMLAKQDFSRHFINGSHGSTYGGNPLATHVVCAVLKELLKPGFMKQVRETGRYMHEGFQALARRSNKITDIRGIGLMLGVDIDADVTALLRALRDAGLMATRAGKNTLRLIPPLLVTSTEVDEAISIIEEVLKGSTV